jgi:hypothetical protein
MPRYQQSDDGKIVEGRVVVYMSGPQALALVQRSAKAALAKANATMLAAAAKNGTPFCEECDHAQRELAGLKAKKR